MSVSINENSYIPDYNSFDIFGRYKLPFILLLIVIIIAFVLLFSIFNRDNLNSDNARIPILILEIVLFAIFIFVVVLNYKWLNDNNYSFTTEIKNLFTDKITQIDVRSEEDEPEQKENKCEERRDSGEVFHIPRNKYTYADAMDVCKRLNSRLATYDEVEDAYKNGANWCSYGWSDDHMALFPTQYKTWQSYQELGRKELCGRPGVNGGYNNHLLQQLGANCFGKKQLYFGGKI
jgi:hypothetical protein